MGFFRGHKRRGSFDLFSSYDHFIPGWKGIIILALMFGLGTVLGALILIGLKAFAGSDLALKYGILIIYPVSFIPALLYASASSRLNEHRVAAVPIDGNLSATVGKMTVILISACVFSTVATAYILEAAVMLLPEMSQAMKDQLENLMNGMPIWATFISVSLFAPLFEEWLCRGLILRGLLQKTNPALAISLSAAFFAVIHGNIWQGLPAFGMGLLFGYVYYRTGSLKLTMLMHFTNNSMALAFSRIPQFKDAETFMDILSPWAYWSIFALCVVIVASSVAVIRGISTVGHKTLPKRD